MAIPKFLEDLLIISKLGDNPGTDNGLTSSGLRGKFDEAGVKIQKYINDTLIPALSVMSNPEEGLNMKNDIAMGGHRVTGLGEPVADDDAVPLGYVKKVGNHHNLLDNSDFRNPVNQRGQTSYSSGYGFDRWTIYAANSGMEKKEGYITITGAIWQNVPNVGGKVYTLAGKKKDGTIVCVSGSFESGAVASGGELLFNGSSVGFNSVRIAAGDWLWVALYEGEYTAETLPEYQPKGYENELLVCKQYDPATGEYMGYLSAPPMAYGVEYRTTERHNSKVVYTKIIYAGAFPVNGNMDVLLGEASAMPYAPFREEVTVTSNDGRTRKNNLNRSHWSDGSGRYLGIEPPSGISVAGFGVDVTIWYTKD